MDLKTIVFFIIISLILGWKDAAIAIEPENTEIHEDGDNFTLAHVKSLFGKIKKLEDEVSQLRTAIASCATKDEVRKLLEDREKTNAGVNAEIQPPSKLIEVGDICEKENKQITQLKETVSSYADKYTNYETQIENLEELLIEKEDTCSELQTKVKNLTKKLNELKATKVNSCTQKVTLSDDVTFEVLRNSDIAGPGWTVIQQRIGGGVDFNRNWTEYKEGFGDFWDGDFFLGLRKIHRLTSGEPKELYIHMESLDGPFFVRYDKFAISGEDDQYALSQLGEFSGNSTDELSNLLSMKFTTYDRKNDNNYYGNCAKEFRGGWWFNDCADCNLNGVYGREMISGRKIFWGGESTITQVRMLIRPKPVKNNF